MALLVLGGLYAVQALSKGDACNVNSECPGEFPCLYNVETYNIRVRTPDRTNWFVTETINGKEYKKEGKFPAEEVQKMVENGGVAMKDEPCKDFTEPAETLRCICTKKVDVQGTNGTHTPDSNDGDGGSDGGSDAADNISSALWSITKAILSFLFLVAIIGLILFCLYSKRDNIYAMFNKLESKSGHVDTAGDGTSGKTMPTDKSKIDSTTSTRSSAKLSRAGSGTRTKRESRGRKRT